MESIVALSKSELQQRRRGIRRRLPEKVLIGYATDCNEKVSTAVRNGVNVVVWSFMEISKDIPTGDITVSENSLNFGLIRQVISELDKEGFGDTVHLVSFGGKQLPIHSMCVQLEDFVSPALRVEWAASRCITKG